MAEELNTTKTDHEYGGSEIQVLEGLEAVRKRRCPESRRPAAHKIPTRP